MNEEQINSLIERLEWTKDNPADVVKELDIDCKPEVVNRVVKQRLFMCIVCGCWCDKNVHPAAPYCYVCWEER